MGRSGGLMFVLFSKIIRGRIRNMLPKLFKKLFNKKSPKDILENMIGIVKKCREKYEGDLGGELYTKETVSPDKIEYSIQMFSKLLPDATKINQSEIVAIFLSCGQRCEKCFSILLFTVNGFYYDVGGKDGKPGFVQWSKIKNVVRRINLSSEIRKEIKFEFYGGEREESIFMPAKYLHSVNYFIIPVLKELSNSVEKEEMYDNETSIISTLYVFVKLLSSLLFSMSQPTINSEIPRNVLDDYKFITEEEYELNKSEKEKNKKVLGEKKS